MADDATPGVARYRALIALWMAARDNAGGKLTQTEEARWAGDCDRVWVTLTDDEQDVLDHESRNRGQSPPST